MKTRGKTKRYSIKKELYKKENKEKKVAFFSLERLTFIFLFIFIFWIMIIANTVIPTHNENRCYKAGSSIWGSQYAQIDCNGASVDVRDTKVVRDWIQWDLTLKQFLWLVLPVLFINFLYWVNGYMDKIEEKFKW